MKTSAFGVMAMGLTLADRALAGIRQDLTHTNINIAQMEGEYKIDYNAQEVLFTDSESDFEEAFRCSKRSGKQLTQNEHGTFIACCRPGEKLMGSLTTAFDCCEPGEQIIGSRVSGYGCCLPGQDYDKSRGCHYDAPECHHGKVLTADGRCMCPANKYEDEDGHCRRLHVHSTCESGVQEGKCYVFTLDHGHPIKYSSNGFYALADDASAKLFGKFKFCKTEACEGRSSVNPNDEVRIHDVHSNRNEWLNSASNGAAIGLTSKWADAGKFSITKWTKGSYCLSGSKHGLSPAKCGGVPAMSFNTLHHQACQPLHLVEVPCDIRNTDNNCVWNHTHNV